MKRIPTAISQELAQLKETIDVLTDASMMRQVAAGRAFYKRRRKGASFEDVFGEPLIPRRRKKQVRLYKPDISPEVGPVDSHLSRRPSEYYP